MSKKNKNKLHPARDFQHTVCGKVRIDFNEENEVKTAIIASDAFKGREDEVISALWDAYKREKTAEWRKSFDRHTIQRKNGRKLSTPLHAETKPFRQRTFQTVASGHPATVEIRVEGLTTMIKIAAPQVDKQSGVKSSVLRRTEIRIAQQFPGQVKFSEIPGAYGPMLTDLFQSDNHRFSGAMTQSWREKMTVPILWKYKGDMYVVDYERARDIGVLQSRAGHKSDITEMEGEVKKIYKYEDYMRGEPVNIKKALDYAGWDHNEAHRMIDGFLNERLSNFLEFANGWLDTQGYEGCKMVAVTHSKSQPAIDAFHKVLAAAPRSVAKAAVARAGKHKGFVVDAALNGLRRQMR